MAMSTRSGRQKIDNDEKSKSNQNQEEAIILSTTNLKSQDKSQEQLPSNPSTNTNPVVLSSVPNNEGDESGKF